MARTDSSRLGHLGDPAGVVGHRPERVERDDQAAHRELRHHGDADPVEAGDLVGGDDPTRDHEHGERGRAHADGEALDDVRRVAGLRGPGDRLDRVPARARVELGDRDEQERNREADQRRAVELPEAEAALVERQRDGDEAEGREPGRDDHALVESVDDRAVLADLGEVDADYGGEDRDAAEREREERQVPEREGRPEQHHRDGGDRVGLEQVGRHARAVADVVADVVGDHGRVARVVLRDARLDLADEVSSDVGGLREDAAAEAREDRDQRPAEGEADQVVDRRLLAVVEDAGEDPVVAGHAEQAEAHDEQAGDRAGAERHLEGRAQAALRRLRRAHVRANGDVHADEARGGGENRADREADRRPPAELVVEADHEERHEGDARDRQVLPAEVRRGALLHGAGDLLHPLGAGGLAQQPGREVEPKPHGDAGADKRKGDRVVIEEIHQASVRPNPSQSTRRGASARRIMYHKRRRVSRGRARRPARRRSARATRPR